jgi:hypothetical protein
MKDKSLNKKELKALVKNTIVLGNLLPEKMDAMQKLDLMSLVRHNIEVIKSQDGNTEYVSEIQSAEKNLNNLLEKLKEPNFLESISNAIQGVLKSIG